ncbi:3-hydroxyacyl-ACP dehydratase FabZ family protein [Kutzneria buriramensis]|uniref:3-hydroxyacyl-ACP dehydratase FabZ family protein n=1 Tax=Kutzneria buriramensis TaxID=1045776 RepID=UPI001FEC0217|nr:hypothetical protein [Kutzneria buriramensis]
MSPVIGQLQVVSGDTVRVPISPDEPVFAGHYPDSPIFPGMCLVEYARLGALLLAPEAGLELAALESARFRAPVLPGDELTITVSWRRDGQRWRCSAHASTGRGAVATVRLRLRVGGTA